MRLTVYQFFLWTSRIVSPVLAVIHYFRRPALLSALFCANTEYWLSSPLKRSVVRVISLK